MHLNSSPIVELKNEQYFYLITTLLVIHLVVALINSTSFESIVISLLEVLFYFLFARYISLYREYNELKEASSKKKKIKKEEAAGDK